LATGLITEQSTKIYGADANLTDIFGRTAKVLARKKGNSAVVDLLPDPPAPESEQ
jgi:hypothetical protein